VDGFILIPATGKNHDIRYIQNKDTPCVLIDRLIENCAADAVLVDNIGGSFAAVSHLIESGVQKIGFIGGDQNLTPARERYAGYKNALKKHGIEIDETIIRFGDFHVESGYSCMEELLSIPDPPNHIFIANYYMHLGATKFLIESDSPQVSSVHLSSFDDMGLPPFLGFNVISVAQPIEEIGKKAASLLLSRIAGADIPFPQTLRLPTKIIEHTDNRRRFLWKSSSKENRKTDFRAECPRLA
jgi:LacI family transcriptional regulator